MFTIPNVVEWWATASADQPAIILGDESLCYAQLHRWSDAAAARLAAEGVRRGDRIALLGENSIEWCVAALAAIKAGGLLVPLNCRYTASELASVIRNCTPRLVLAVDEQLEKVRAADADILTLPLTGFIAAARDQHAAPPNVDALPDDEIAIIYTSGSTAEPKGVVHSHRSRLAYAYESSLIDPGWGAGKKALGLAPLYTGAGTVTFLQFMALGMTVYLTVKFDGDAAFRTITEERIDLLSGVPTFFERIAAAPGFASADLSHVGFASVGGARVSRQLSDLWHRQGVVLRQLYGLTEGGGADTTMDREGAITHPEKCGRGGPFTRLRVIDPEGRDCPAGMAGEILIRGPIVMTSYWNNPEATAQAFRDGWLLSGDIGMLDDAGDLTLIDRLKDIIISGGLNISPIDIEAVISAFPGIDEVSVFGVDDEKFGETPMAIIFGSADVVVSEVIEHCNRHLSDYKVPRYLVVSGEPLPRLPTGKIAKRELRSQYAASAATLTRVR